MSTGGVDKPASQKSSPHEKTKKKKKVLVRVSFAHAALKLTASTGWLVPVCVFGRRVLIRPPESKMAAHSYEWSCSFSTEAVMQKFLTSTFIGS